MYYFILIAICMVAFAIAWYSEGKTVGSPGTLLSLSLGIGVALALAGTGSWNNWGTLSGTIILIFCLGFFGFFSAGAFVRAIAIPKRIGSVAKRHEQIQVRIPVFSRKQTAVLVLAGLALSLFWYISVSQIIGLSDFTSIAAYFKEGAEQRVETSLLTLIRVFTRAMCMLAVLMLVESIRRKEGKDVFAFGALFLAFAFPSAVVGMRTELGHVVIGAVVASILLSSLDRRGDDTIHLKGLLAVLVLCPVIIQLFSLVVELTGRRAMALSPWEYFTYYLGAGVPDFDRFIVSFPDAAGVTETFNGLQGVLCDLGLIQSVGIPASQHWVAAGMNNLCNTYTIFRPAYHDFGLVGVPIYFFVLGVLFYSLYYSAINKRSAISLVAYSYLSYILIDAVRDDFFSMWLGSWGLINLFVILFFFKYCSKTSQEAVLQEPNTYDANLET